MKRKNGAMAMAGLALLLLSCEKDISDGAGRKAPIIFSTTTTGYDAENEDIRSARELEPETVVVPMGNDMYMYATLRPDPEEGLRAAVPLTNGQKVRFAAFNKTTGSQVGSTVTYTHTGGKLVPSGNPVGVDPDNTTDYRFVAYSYYGNRGADPVETGIAPSQDLVWGWHERKIEDTETSRTVPITMRHLFSRVKVKIDASTIASAIVDIDDVKIEGGQTVDLTDIELGTIAETGVAVEYDITSSLTGSGAVKAMPDYLLFYPSPTAVTIGSIELTMKPAGTNKTFSSLAAFFTKTLEAGKSYTLEVDVRKLTWAKSNIYWNGSTLTFSESGNSNYQGVFFKWGSLVGIAGGVDAATNPVVYIPNVVAYPDQAGSGTGAWDGSKTLSASVYNGNLNNIPAVSSPLGPYTLYKNPDFANYKGDICSYLTGGVWRMPNLSEFGVVADYSSWVSGTTSGLNSAGTGTITSGKTYNVISSFFPASGGYNIPMDTSGKTSLVGTYATYLGGDILFFFSEAQHMFSNSGVIDIAASVRCVKP
jgi:hypothetical protein